MRSLSRAIACAARPATSHRVVDLARRRVEGPVRATLAPTAARRSRTCRPGLARTARASRAAASAGRIRPIRVARPAGLAITIGPDAHDRRNSAPPARRRRASASGCLSSSSPRRMRDVGLVDLRFGRLRLGHDPIERARDPDAAGSRRRGRSAPARPGPPRARSGSRPQRRIRAKRRTCRETPGDRARTASISTRPVTAATRPSRRRVARPPTRPPARSIARSPISNLPSPIRTRAWTLRACAPSPKSRAPIFSSTSLGGGLIAGGAKWKRRSSAFAGLARRREAERQGEQRARGWRGPGRHRRRLARRAAAGASPAIACAIATSGSSAAASAGAAGGRRLRLAVSLAPPSVPESRGKVASAPRRTMSPARSAGAAMPGIGRGQAERGEQRKEIVGFQARRAEQRRVGRRLRIGRDLAAPTRPRRPRKSR